MLCCRTDFQFHRFCFSNVVAVDVFRVFNGVRKVVGAVFHIHDEVQKNATERRLDSVGRTVGDRRQDWFGVKHMGAEDAMYGLPNIPMVGVVSLTEQEEQERDRS